MKNNRNNGKGRKRAPKPSGANKTSPKTQRVAKNVPNAAKSTPRTTPKNRVSGNHRAKTKPEQGRKVDKNIKKKTIQPKPIAKNEVKTTETPPEKSTKPATGQPLITITIMRHADQNDGHEHGKFDSIDDNYVSVGFTTKKNKGKGSTNYTLEVDPLGGNKQSYMRRQGTVDKKETYSDPKTGVMTPKDHARAVIYAERAKNKHLAKLAQKDKKK